MPEYPLREHHNSLGVNQSFKNNETDLSMEESIDVALAKYKYHPSIAAIRKQVKVYQKFQFSNVDLLKNMNKIGALNTSQANSGNIPRKIIQDAKEVTSQYRTRCINIAIDTCYFPDILTVADVCTIHKNGDEYRKTNYKPISVLPGMSKIFERIMNEQIYQHFVSILFPLLTGFRQGYNTQYALFRVLEMWKKQLGMSATIGTILLDLSKAYDCIPTTCSLQS